MMENDWCVQGHNYAIKRIRFSPHHSNILVSSSYDYTTRVWDCRNLQPPEVFSHHREFVYGIDISCLLPDKIADCSWDRTVSVYTHSIKPIVWHLFHSPCWAELKGLQVLVAIVFILFVPFWLFILIMKINKFLCCYYCFFSILISFGLWKATNFLCELKIVV